MDKILQCDNSEESSFFPDRIRFNGNRISLLLQAKEEDQSVYKGSKLLILLIFYVYSVDNYFLFTVQLLLFVYKTACILTEKI